ncbi:MAG: class I SAM-dependent methyltransferase [Polyangiales bacterium]
MALFPRLKGRTAQPDEVLEDLIELHRARPGITEATLGGFRDREGRTGYDLLAEKGRGVVLDLGCGNGPLIAALGGRGIGVDACEPEVEIARKRFPEATIHVARAQSLPLADASVDTVLSHHAFYLFDPIEPVIAEIARVLRPGGSFAFATTSFRDREEFPVFSQLMRDFGENTKKENPTFRGWGDRRVWSREGLTELFARDFEPFTIEEYVLSIEEDPDALVDRLARFFYSFELQSPALQAATRASWRETLSSGHLDFPGAIVSMRR